MKAHRNAFGDRITEAKEQQLERRVRFNKHHDQADKAWAICLLKSVTKTIMGNVYSLDDIACPTGSR
jgi:hypothetical protein